MNAAVMSRPVGDEAQAPLLTTRLAAPLDVPADFMAEVLKPYRENAKYLQSAQITRFETARTREGGKGPTVVATGRGRFSIPESCYIDDTGHFNAVEFNICYNQLAYVIVGKAVEAGLFAPLTPISFTEYKKRQLSSMLIVKLESRFTKQLKSGDFWGELTIDRITSVGPAYFCFTSIAFSDVEGVKSKGSVVITFNPNGA